MCVCVHGCIYIDPLPYIHAPIYIYRYYMVKGRSQFDLNNGVTRLKALQQEAAFFAKHEVFGSKHNAHAASADRLGIPALATKLSALLVEHIQSNLPDLAEEMRVRSMYMGACMHA